MAYEQKDGQGVLFPNDRKDKPTQPDFKGKVTINGVQYELAAWLKPGRNDTNFLSLSAKPMQERRGPPEGFRAPQGNTAQPSQRRTAHEDFFG